MCSGANSTCTGGFMKKIVFLFKGGDGKLTLIQKFRKAEALSNYTSKEKEHVVVLHSRDLLRNKEEASLILEKILSHKPDILFAKLQPALREILYERNILFCTPFDLTECKSCVIYEEVNGIKIENTREIFSFLGWKPTFTLWYK